jgi:hypothetical protein
MAKSEEAKNKGQRFIALWCEAFKDVYDQQYNVSGKDAGQVKLFVRDKSVVVIAEWVGIAKRAWVELTGTLQSLALEISTFIGKCNAIRVAVMRCPNGHSKTPETEEDWERAGYKTWHPTPKGQAWQQT